MAGSSQGARSGAWGRTLTATLAAVCLSGLLAAAQSPAPVAAAAQRGDVEAVRALLRRGADVNATQGDGMSALHWAAERGQADVVDMLLYAGANPEAVTRIGQYTPLHVASRAGHAEVVDRLLDAGANPAATTSTSGVTALHLAAASGDAAIVRALAARGVDVDARETSWGQTPLIFAASQNRVEVIEALLELGADPALTSRTVDLVEQGKLADLARKRQRKVLDAFDVERDEDLTPSQVRAAVRAARDVYRSGEVPEDEDDDENRRPPTITAKGGLTPLLHAARQGHIEAALALVAGGADVNHVSEGDATSPLLMATINGQFDLAMALLERGADPNLAAGINGATPLWAAVNAQWQPRTRFPQPQEHGLQRADYLALMKALLEAGADPDARLTLHPWYMVYTGCGNRNCGLADTNGSTAFWRAAYATDVAAMQLLIEHGADPNIPTIAPPQRRRRGGTTAANEDDTLPAVTPGGPGLWAPTKAAGADRRDPSGLPPYQEGGPGIYPLHAASGVGYGEGFAGNAHRHVPDGWLTAVTYLVELGADVNMRDHNGYTALHHAAARGDNEMILYLVDQGADVTAVSRLGQTTADMANGPVQRVSPIPETVALLESLGSKNNHNCVSC